MSLVNRDFWMGVFVGAAAGFVQMFRLVKMAGTGKR